MTEVHTGAKDESQTKARENKKDVVVHIDPNEGSSPSNGPPPPPVGQSPNPDQAADAPKPKDIAPEKESESLRVDQAGRRKPVEPDMPWCSTATPDYGAKVTGSSMQKSWIAADTVWPWKDYKVLYVEFRNVDLLSNWTMGDGQPMNTLTILRYANTWSDMGGGRIPRFVEVKDGMQPPIRVSFNNDRICESQLGLRAQMIPAQDPTMYLDLHNGCPDDEYKKHVIMHEFGHALGLDHEHQRSNFWNCIQPFTNIEEMKKDLGMTDELFATDWKEIEMGHDIVEYDPDSIMHYWFKVEWLTNGYSDEKKVERDRGKLNDKDAKALLGVHKRHNVLADKPSHLDIQLLKNVYRESHLTINDLVEVHNVVQDARSRWYELGMELNISHEVLHSIRSNKGGHDTDGCLVDVLVEFLHQESPRPSWKQLTDAIASRSVGRRDIAEVLRKQYLDIEYLT